MYVFYVETVWYKRRPLHWKGRFSNRTLHSPHHMSHGFQLNWGQGRFQILDSRNSKILEKFHHRDTWLVALENVIGKTNCSVFFLDQSYLWTKLQIRLWKCCLWMCISSECECINSNTKLSWEPWTSKLHSSLAELWGWLWRNLEPISEELRGNCPKGSQFSFEMVTKMSTNCARVSYLSKGSQFDLAALRYGLTTGLHGCVNKNLTNVPLLISAFNTFPWRRVGLQMLIYSAIYVLSSDRYPFSFSCGGRIQWTPCFSLL